MNTPTCPICQAPQTTANAWREHYTVVILITCSNGHEQLVRVHNSRFVRIEVKKCTQDSPLN